MIYEVETDSDKITIDNNKIRIVGDCTKEYNISEIKECFIVLKVSHAANILYRVDVHMLLGSLLTNYLNKKFLLNKVKVFELHIILKNEPFEEIINCNEFKLISGSQRFVIINRNVNFLVLFLNKWLKEAEDLKKKVPDFDLEREMGNPDFFNCLCFLSSGANENAIAKAYLNAIQHTENNQGK